MKKGKCKTFFVWISVFVLTFFVSMGGAYAYFTATAQGQNAVVTTGVVKVGFSNNTALTSSDSSVDATVLPGGTLTFAGKVENIGDVDIYAILEINLFVDDEETPSLTRYYTIETSSSVISLPDGEEEYNTPAKLILAQSGYNYANFSISLVVDGDLYDNDYQGANIRLEIKARAIQKAHINDAVLATNLILAGNN